MLKTPRLEDMDCPKCGRMSVQVIDYERWVRTGWFCLNLACKHFQVAILRERIVDGRPENKDAVVLTDQRL